MCGRVPPGPAGTRLPRITLGPVTRVAPFSYLHEQIANFFHFASRSVTAVSGQRSHVTHGQVDDAMTSEKYRRLERKDAYRRATRRTGDTAGWGN